MPTTLTLAQLTALKSEFVNDPRGYGYSAYWQAGYDGGLAPMINAVRDGSNPPANPTAAGGTANGSISRFKTTVSPMEIMGVIDVRDFISNASALQAAWFESLMQIAGARIPLADAAGVKTFIRLNLDRAVGNQNGSQIRLDNLAVRFGSRAEELFWTDMVITIDDISECRKVITGARKMTAAPKKVVSTPAKKTTRK